MKLTTITANMTRHKLTAIRMLLMVCALFISAQTFAKQKKILVFSKTTGYQTWFRN